MKKVANILPEQQYGPECYRYARTPHGRVAYLSKTGSAQQCETGKTNTADIHWTVERKPLITTGPSVKITNFFKRLVFGDNALEGRAAALRGIVVWAFIALVALFATQPSGEQASLFDKPIPLPPELGLEQH